MSTSTPSPVKRFLKYVLLGPLIGLALIDLGLIFYFVVNLLTKLVAGGVSADYISNRIGGFFIINIFGFVVAYVVGIIPAVLSGAVAIHCENYKDECTATMIVGAIPFLVICASQPLGSESLSWALLALISAASAFVCATIKRD